MKVPAHFYTMATYSIADMVELRSAISNLYYTKPRVALVLNGGEICALIYLNGGKDTRYIYAADWAELIERAEADSDIPYIASHREAVAGDIFCEVA